MALGELWVKFLIAQSECDRRQEDELMKAQQEQSQPAPDT